MSISSQLKQKPDTVILFHDICTASCRGLNELILEIQNKDNWKTNTLLSASFSKPTESALLPYSTFLKEDGIPFLPYREVDNICTDLKEAWCNFFRELTRFLPSQDVKSLQDSYFLMHDAMIKRIKETPTENASNIYNQFIKQLEDISKMLAKGKNKNHNGTTKSSQTMVREIYNVTVLGIEPDPNRIAGGVRQLQVIHGVNLYKPTTKYKKGVSSRKAAKLTINDIKFKNISGAYTIKELDSLARAIEREFNDPKLDVAT